MYRVTGFVTGKGKVEKTIVASSAKEAEAFYKKELNAPKVSVTVVSVIMEAKAKEIEEEEAQNDTDATDSGDSGGD